MVRDMVHLRRENGENAHHFAWKPSCFFANVECRRHETREELIRVLRTRVVRQKHDLEKNSSEFFERAVPVPVVSPGNPRPLHQDLESQGVGTRYVHLLPHERKNVKAHRIMVLS